VVQRRHLSNEALLVHIRAVYAVNRGAYGWPRIWRQLRAEGIRVGKQRVQRLMQQHGIRARGKRRFRIATTDSRHGLPIAPNLLDRNFTAARPNQVWVGDITYIPTDEAEAIVPTLTREDPRYYTLGRGGFVRRTGYSVSRLFVTRTDGGGRSPNISEIVGNGAAAGIANLYYPSQGRTWTKTGQRWLTQVALDGASNLIKEYWPFLNSKLFRRK
jgi:hypothetical protein